MIPRASQESQTIAHEIVESMTHMATLPEVTLNIIDIVEDPTSSASDLHQIVATDPALSARVLKVVNSAFYGLPRQIGSINRAISLLGLNAVKNIAVAASLGKIFRGGSGCSSFEARELWSHSVATAATSCMISREINSGSSDEAFLAGLLHDIGFMIALQYDRNRFAQAFSLLEMDDLGVPRNELLLQERIVFGVDHQDLGAVLCEKWKFPRTLMAAAAHHHDPTVLSGDEASIPWVVHVADRLAASATGGFRLDLPVLEVNPASYDAIGLGPAALQGLLGELPGCIEEIELSMAA
jgi:putative nucleotidyltransferase with HDIG domain